MADYGGICIMQSVYTDFNVPKRTFQKNNVVSGNDTFPYDKCNCAI